MRVPKLQRGRWWWNWGRPLASGSRRKKLMQTWWMFTVMLWRNVIEKSEGRDMKQRLWITFVHIDLTYDYDMLKINLNYPQIISTKMLSPSVWIIKTPLVCAGHNWMTTECALLNGFIIVGWGCRVTTWIFWSFSLLLLEENLLQDLFILHF